ncbi:cytochrome ubiquinol oxidase subunit I [Gryllotalpicola daejeonensis]|uniref:Cytochrome ubiquinol oxidase subunit I n=1 Tax=Gryllotalpicola daejeonensis TaxID=993087 RepID=A0ABP7ZE47_9MICO
MHLNALDPVLIARWQFGITTVYHFWMVPLTIGLGPLVAYFQVRWHRSGDARFYRATKFWGKLYLINFIMGVATGIVQEFQFGLAWAQYSRFVGNIFGAPLAMEALLAFFLESTFLGLWIFGWGRLPKALHTATLCIAVAGSIVSAYFIIVANSWMQHPVGVTMEHGQPVMTNVWAILGNNTAIWSFLHTILGSLMVGGMFLLGISWYQLWQRRKDGIDGIDVDGRVIPGENAAIAGRDREDHRLWLGSLRVGALVTIVAFAFVFLTGDQQGKLMFVQQPMKMAAAEAACETTTDFSVLSFGAWNAESCHSVHDVIVVPGVLSFLANGNFDTPVKGVNQLIPIYQERYGTHAPNGNEINYVPLMPVTYWGFRVMITLGGLTAFAALVALWLTRKGTVPRSKWIMRLALLGILAPFAANSAGWVFTEMGRQPFVVAPNPTGDDNLFLLTQVANSPSVGAGELIFSLSALGGLYLILMIVEAWLITKYVRGGAASAIPELGKKPDDTDASGGGTGQKSPDDVLAFAY